MLYFRTLLLYTIFIFRHEFTYHQHNSHRSTLFSFYFCFTCANSLMRFVRYWHCMHFAPTKHRKLLCSLRRQGHNNILPHIEFLLYEQFFCQPIFVYDDLMILYSFSFHFVILYCFYDFVFSVCLTRYPTKDSVLTYFFTRMTSADRLID